MRIIDADSLKAELAKWFPMVTLDGIDAKVLFAQIMRDIDNTPTVACKRCACLGNDNICENCLDYECFIEKGADATKIADDLFKKLMGGDLP